MAENTTSGAAGTSKAAAAAKAGAGLILFTLATGQFLMTLDTSVMNVSIATVAEDLGTTITGVQTAITLYTLVMASLMVLGGKIGSIMGRKQAFSIGCVIYGCGSMTTALAPNLAGAHHRLVVPRGHRRRADHAGHRRPRGRQLPARRAPQGLRAHRRRRGHRRGRRPGDRRVHDHVLLLALRVRRRGPHRHRHPDPGAARGRRAARRAAAPRPHRRRDLVGRPRAHRPRRAQVVHVGLAPAQGGRGVAVRPLADDLVHHRRTLLPVAVPALADAPGARRQGAAHLAGAAARQAAHRRPHHVPVPVHDPGRAVLHRPAVPLGGARASRRWPPACACCRSRCRCCWRRSASPSSSPTPTRGASRVSACSRSWPASWC